MSSVPATPPCLSISAFYHWNQVFLSSSLAEWMCGHPLKVLLTCTTSAGSDLSHSPSLWATAMVAALGWEAAQYCAHVCSPALALKWRHSECQVVFLMAFSTTFVTVWNKWKKALASPDSQNKKQTKKKRERTKLHFFLSLLKCLFESGTARWNSLIWLASLNVLAARQKLYYN